MFLNLFNRLNYKISPPKIKKIIKIRIIMLIRSPKNLKNPKNQYLPALIQVQALQKVLIRKIKIKYMSYLKGNKNLNKTPY